MTSPPRVSWLGSPRGLALVLAMLGLAGCGSAPETHEAHHRDEPGSALGGELNVCPIFTEWLLLPRTIRPQSSALIRVVVVDPDARGNDPVLSWHATSGAFSEPVASDTEYSCSESGVQLLTLTAWDRDDCESRLEIDVECLADE